MNTLVVFGTSFQNIREEQIREQIEKFGTINKFLKNDFYSLIVRYLQQ